MLKEERKRFNDRIRELTEGYEKQAESLRKEIALLNKLVSENEDHIRSLNSTIALLQNRKEEDKND